MLIPCLTGGCPGVGVDLAQPQAVLDCPLPHSLCGEEVGTITLGQYLWQLAHHRNFLWFVVMDLVQVWEQSPHPGGAGSASLRGIAFSNAGKPVLGFA